MTQFIIENIVFKTLTATSKRRTAEILINLCLDINRLLGKYIGIASVNGFPANGEEYKNTVVLL